MKKDLQVAIHFLGLAGRMSKTYIPLLIITAIMKASTPFLSIFMPKLIIDEVLGGRRIERLVLYVCITILGNGAINLINKYLDTQVDIANFAMVAKFELHMGKHIMNMDYENLEDRKIWIRRKKQSFRSIIREFSGECPAA